MEVRAKTVVVAGAARGVGRAPAEGFGRDGGHIVLLDVNCADLAITRGQLQDRGITAPDYTVDVGSESQEAAESNFLHGVVVLVTHGPGVVARHFHTLATCCRIGHAHQLLHRHLCAVVETEQPTVGHCHIDRHDEIALSDDDRCERMSLRRRRVFLNRHFGDLGHSYYRRRRWSDRRGGYRCLWG